MTRPVTALGMLEGVNFPPMVSAAEPHIALALPSEL